MVYLTLFILYVNFLNYCYCFQVPSKFSSIGDNAIFLCVLAAFGTISLIGACAICFRRKKTFEKLENEAGSPENIKKNEFPIFRALSTEINESSAIVPCERNNLSRDNLLNSSDNLNDNESDILRKNECIDSNDVVLLEKNPTSSQREKNHQISRDTILFETEKKHQSPSSKTPLLYAKNVQSYQEQQPISEQILQKKSAAVVLLSSDNNTLNDLYCVGMQTKTYNELDSLKGEINESIEHPNTSTINESKSFTISSNPFLNSTTEDDTVKEVNRDDTSEIESSINDNSERYQILEEETDCEEVKINECNEDENENVPTRLERQNSKGSNCSTGDKSIEEALRALDIAIGFEEDDDCDELEVIVVNSERNVNLEDIKEEATFLVESIVNDCENILKQKTHVTDSKEETLLHEVNMDSCDFDKFSKLHHQNISTPCASLKINTNNIIGDNINVAKELFFEGIDLSIDETKNETFPVPFDNIENNKNNNQTFEIPSIKIEMEKDKEELNSEDLTTVTPVNTPIELSYSNETWNKISCENDEIIASNTVVSETQYSTFIPNEKKIEGEKITFNHDGWYLHSQNNNDTFDIICEDDDENDEGNMVDMSSTFDQLRRQLTEMLPHAQGMSAHNDFLDDDDLNKDSNSPSDNYGIKYGELDEASNAGSFDLIASLLNPEPVTELNINYNNNYKRPLSPILEESECDETCRTFVMNETKLLDSTSTGIMESASADAVMGQMNKTLMASNDTLFNFEDTLSDPTDILMSPRIHTAGSSTSSTLSRQESQDRISNERTPTNEELPKITSNDTIGIKCQDPINILKNNIRQHPLNLDLNVNESINSAKYELTKLTLQEDGSWPIELPEAQQIINDLSSPEQNRTTDSLSFEQDITYTIDDQKTCVSFVLKNDEERISEISEPLFASESLENMLGDDDDKAGSLIIDDAVSFDTDDNFNFEMNDENDNQNDLEITGKNEICLEKNKDGNFDNDSINFGEMIQNFDADSLEVNAKILIDEMEGDSIPTSQISKSVYSNDSINNINISVQNINDSECIAVSEMSKEQDSSEDNESNHRKKGSSTQDIRQVSCNQSVMSTSFSKEWSDDDSSHSSIEFMYVKGGVENIFSPTRQKDDTVNDENKQKNVKQTGKQSEDDIKETEYQEWNIETRPHRISPALEDVGESEDDESVEEESEFVPSCWDQSLQPSKSSLKSPEKEKETSLDEEEHHQIKTKRRVVFKIQRYHSVYEYPSEVVQLSPAYSEPQLWSNYLNDNSGSIDYFAYSNQLHNMPNTIDGFNISSSSRPFHGNNVQLHNTWPNENDHDFSWSQFQDLNENSDADRNFEFPLKIEWPIRKNAFFDEDDSGLCETSEPPSAELNFSKSSVLMPIELTSSSCSEVSDFMSTDTKEIAVNIDDCLKPKNFVNRDDDMSEKLNDTMPTPSGSMDSLSSNSHSSSNSSSPPSFTTFGKDKILKEIDLIGKRSIIFIENDQNATQLENVIPKRSKNVDGMENIKVIIGSSDDDSGFENVKCEAK